MIRRLALCLGAIVVGLMIGFASQPTAQAHDCAGQPDATYTYDRHCNAAAAHTATERGPPASYENHTLDGADDPRSSGALARSVVITAYAYTYTVDDSPEWLAQVLGIGARTPGPGPALVRELSSFATGSVAAESGGDLTRVGRWMSAEEHDAMVESRMVQEGGGGTTYVAHPADPAAYGSEAATGSRYVEFDVPRTSLRPAGKEGWAQIPGPNSLYGRLAQMRGEPVPQFPPALDIEWLFTK